MKKLYSIMLVAVAMLGISLPAKADVSAKLTWDIPGSVEIYVGSTGESSKVSLPEGATSYDASIVGQSYGSVYARASEGYYLVDAVCANDNKTIAPASYGTRQVAINISVSQHGGHSVHINAEKLEYDGTVSVDLVSAGEVTATFGAREVKLNGGKQYIRYSTKFENSVAFSAPAEGAVEPYIKHNGGTIAWAKKHNWDTSLSHNAITPSNGDEFEVKWNDQDPVDEPPVAMYTVTLDYADAMARQSVDMVRNVTKMKTITARESFEVEEGDIVSVTFNTADYDISVNGQAIEPSSGKNSTWKSDAINSNTTIKVAATEREYGNATLSISILNPEGVVLRNGAFDGPVIDLSEYTPSSETFKGETFSNYTIDVSLKNPKIFVSQAEGWYIYRSGYGDPSNEKQYEHSEVARTGESTPLHVWTHKITRDKKLVVYLKGEEASANLKDDNNASSAYPLKAGYNEFMFDPVYSGSFTVLPITSSSEDKFSVYKNYSAVAKDDNGVYSGISLDQDGVLHVFAKVPESKKHTYAISNSTPAAPEITYDRVLKAEGASFSVFVGSEVCVKPAAGCIVKIDDEKVPLTDGAYTFTQPTGALTSHTISIESPTAMEITPGDGAELDAFESISVSFPDAETVTFDQDFDPSEIALTKTDNSWSNWGWSIVPAENAECPSFILTPNMPVPNGTFNFSVHEGFFKINGNMPNALKTVQFTINRQSSSLDWEVYPDGDIQAHADFGPQVTFSYGEEANAEFNIEDPSEIKVVFNDKSLEYFTDYTIELNGGFIMVGLNDDYKAITGTLRISFPAGAFKINGAESPAMEHTWLVVAPKTYTISVTPEFDATALTPEDELIFTVALPEAETAEVFNEYGFQLRENGFGSDTYMQKPDIKQVDNAGCPTFSLTFPAVGADKNSVEFDLNIYYGAFTLDGANPSPEFSKTYNLTIASANVAEYVIVPADGATVESIETISISFPNATTVTLADGAESGQTDGVFMSGANWSYYTEFFTVSKVDDASVPTFTLTPNAPAKTNGSYSLSIGAETFLINGKIKNDEITASYTLYKEIKPEDLTYIISPESGEDVENKFDVEIIVAFAEGLELDMESFDMDKMSLSFAGNELSMGQDYYADPWSNMLSFTVKKSVFEKKTGALVLSLKQGWCKIAGIDAPAVDGAWNVVGDTDGIADIFGDGADAFTVVTIDGRVIIKDGDAAQLKQLAAGLYIINGKKVYLNK